MLLAALTSLLQIALPMRAGDPLARHTTVAAQVAPFLVLMMAFVVDASSLDLVARYGGADLPLFYRISAVWGGRAGPLLLWAALLGLVTWFMAGRSNPIPLEVRLLHGMTLIVLCISWILAPFAAATGADGTLNPLLQTDLMVIHPPLVFSYYSLCLAVACVALAGLIEGRDARVVHETQLHWARAGFLVGAVGIGLGGLWAYTVLDWGGYWAWDPVETASILPWFALLMILHARARTGEGRSSAMTASPALGLIAGALAIHATLVTRANGVWASVHSFVGNEDAKISDDAYIRILQIADQGAAGIEVMAYLILMLILAGAAVVWLLCQQRQAMSEAGHEPLTVTNPPLATVLLLAAAAVGAWIGSSAITLVGFALMLLLVRGQAEHPPLQWVFGGVFLMLFASWTWTATIPQAVVGMAIFLGPWMMSAEEEDLPILAALQNTAARTRLARSIPWFGGAAFLGLTWLLLTAEIDGTSLAAHEFYGAPIIALGVLALTLYAWGRSVEARKGNMILLATLAASLALALNADRFALPGDPELLLTSTISRGAISLFLLTWLFLALPPTITEVWKTAKSTIPSLRAQGIRARSNAARLRYFGSHLAHLGILLLLMGHVMTTTLVDRADPSHLVALEKDVATEFNGYELIFRDTTLIDDDDPDYPYAIGEGFAGFIIEVQKDGERVGEVTPGILRFNFFQQRSEVDRIVRPSGDLIFILDSTQASVSLGAMMSGEIDEITQIRVTIHDLQGSHLVWTGWGFIMLGGLFALLSSERGNGAQTTSEEEE
jgi:cytochrome c biogenesis factor